MQIILLEAIPVSLYLIAAFFQLLKLAGRVDFKKNLLLALGLLAVIMHAWVLYRWIDLYPVIVGVGGGQNLSALNMLSLLFWLVSLLILLIAFTKPVENLLVLVLPLAALSIILVVLFPSDAIVNTVENPGLLIHILSSVIAFSVLCVAGLQAVFLIFLERLLHHKQTSRLIDMIPPLETMESLLCGMIWVGFCLLTFVLVTSLYLFHTLLVDPLSWKFLQKTILAFFAWGIFALLLGGRHFFGWRGRKMNYGTLLGVLIMVVIYFSSLILGVILP